MIFFPPIFTFFSFKETVDKKDFDKMHELYKRMSRMWDELEQRRIKQMHNKDAILKALIELKKDLDADNYNYRLGTLNNIEQVIKENSNE